MEGRACQIIMQDNNMYLIILTIKIYILIILCNLLRKVTLSINTRRTMLRDMSNRALRLLYLKFAIKAKRYLP